MQPWAYTYVASPANTVAGPIYSWHCNRCDAVRTGFKTYAGANKDREGHACPSAPEAKEAQ